MLYVLRHLLAATSNCCHFLLAVIQPLFLICLIFTSSSTLSAQTTEHNVIYIGGDKNYPPYEFLNKQGQPDGYNTELTLAIAEIMGIKVHIELGNWDTMRTLLKDGKLHALQGMIVSEERKQLYQFSPPHAIIHQSIFARVGSPKIAQLTELKGKEVIVQKGGIMHDYLKKTNPQAQLILVETHTAALRLLSSGKHEYALVANLPGMYVGKELELSNIVPAGKPFGAQHYGYAVLQGNDELLAQFSEGLAILINTGRQQKIYDKWLAPLEKSEFNWQQIGKITAGISALLLIILGGIVGWNLMLTKQVTRRTQELKLQQQQLLQADKMASLGMLVSGVAHEINNPSSLLLLNLPVIQESYQDIQELLENHYQNHGDFIIGGLKYSRMQTEIPLMLKDMLDGAHKIRRIVNDLKDFSRQEPTNVTMTNLNDIASTAIRLVDKTISKHSDNFQTNYAQHLPLFIGNAQQIEQVIINLIVNACQALTTKEKGIFIRTFYHEKNNTICLEVKDQGCGIEPNNIPRLGEPFFTTRREKGGTGLGLSISEKIIQEHQGKLEFQSVLGQGTQVTLSLPIVKN